MLPAPLHILQDADILSLSDALCYPRDPKMQELRRADRLRGSLLARKQSKSIECAGTRVDRYRRLTEQRV